jgi:hypothetical protein
MLIQFDLMITLIELLTIGHSTSLKWGTIAQGWGEMQDGLPRNGGNGNGGNCNGRNDGGANKSIMNHR